MRNKVRLQFEIEEAEHDTLHSFSAKSSRIELPTELQGAN